MPRRLAGADDCAYSGLAWDHLKDVIRAEIGAGNYAAIEQVAGLVGNLDAYQLNPSAMYDFLADLPNRLGSQFSDLLGNFNWTTMLNSLVNTAKDQLTSSLVQILPRLAAKFVRLIPILRSPPAARTSAPRTPTTAWRWRPVRGAGAALPWRRSSPSTGRSASSSARRAARSPAPPT